jgi:hypothetical protein
MGEKQGVYAPGSVSSRNFAEWILWSKKRET